jgi:peptidoglycan/LPS O-acetylase OafA/YrhL
MSPDTPSAASAEAPPPLDGSVPTSGLRLHFLDGMRALACLYVLLFHIVSVRVVGHGEPSRAVRFLLPATSRGRYGVVFFIVLSGFSLMLPVARKGHGRLLGGFRNYLYRRARRILPPYYAALGASLGLIVLHNAVGTSHGGEPIEAALKPGSIVSHILLLHNLNFDWAYRINGPMWSVATEWQIYFVFPALLLPLWRHAGALTTAGVAWVAGSIPFFVLPSQSNFYWACPWFVGSFALGMAGATIGFSPGYQGSWLRDRAPWGALASATLVVLGAMIATGLDARIGYPVIDLIVSVLAFCLINACGQHFRSQATGLQGLFARILSSRALVYIGGFSYSLYLMQHPVLRLTERVLGRIPVGYDAQIAIHLLVDSALVMGVAWLFSELFERPFTSGGLLLQALQRRLRRPAPASLAAVGQGQDSAQGPAGADPEAR